MSVFSDPSYLTTENAWILLISDDNTEKMITPILSTANKLNYFAASEFWIIPNLVDKSSHLDNYQYVEGVICTFGYATNKQYSTQNLTFVASRDSVKHFVAAYKSYQLQETGSNAKTILELIKNTKVNGDTGNVEYTSNSQLRYGANLNVLILDSTKINSSNVYKTAGQWISNRNPRFSTTSSSDVSLSSRKLKFAATNEPPYVYKNRLGQLTGFSIELIEKLKHALGFDYEIIFVDDNLKGTKLPNKSWTGVIKYLANNQADLGATLLVPTDERLEVTIKSVNVLTDGISMLAKQVPHKMDFLNLAYPFSLYVWIGMVISIIIISVTLWASDKLSPNSPSKQKGEESKSMFSLQSCCFLVVSSFLMSKVETEPKKLSARLFTLILWTSTLLYMTTYMSNLVGFLVKPNNDMPFTSLADLPTSVGYKWFFLEDSGTLFDRVKDAYPAVVSRAETEWKNEMFVKSNESLEVLKNDYRKILIANTEYLQHRKTEDCSLEMMSEENKVYLTFLASKTFPYMTEFNRELEKIAQEDLSLLTEKYFTSLGRCSEQVVDPNNRMRLNFDYLCGLFAIVGIGIVLSFAYILVVWTIHKTKLCIQRIRSVKFEIGNDYEAEVVVVEKRGIWVTVQCPKTKVQRPEMFFIPNCSLHPDPLKVKNAKMLEISEGSMLRIYYYGKDPVSKDKMFTKFFDKNKKNKHIDLVDQGHDNENFESTA